MSAAGRSLAVLTRSGQWMTVSEIQEVDGDNPPLGRDGSQSRPMKGDTVSKALRKLAEDGKVKQRPAEDGQTKEYCALVAGEGTTTSPHRQTGGGFGASTVNVNV
jgi:hypothetical protein